ncbi:AMP-binding protein [Planctomycetes bacterium K23_9]|uniref:4-chlorobenzoate--CoA ligase n=1 Tax=Stieleria marina TaxID=1930275 RepID=A0A517NYR5_9BACT|nr:4-chlorobenzoate--CoA ligase [Planctomycetes bacterium K23_9]
MNDKPFFVDPVGGRAVTYADFGRDVKDTTIGSDDFTPKGCYELFKVLLAAILSGSSLRIIAGPLGEKVSEDVEREFHLAQSKNSGSEVRSVGKREVQAAQQEKQSGMISESRGGSRGPVSNPLVADDLLNAIKQSVCRIGVQTSGTTAEPKIVQHGAESLVRTVRSGPSHADDVWGFAFHPAHFAGIQVFLQALCNRNTIVKLFGLDVSVAHRAIDSYQITHLSATPTYLRLLCGQSSADTSQGANAPIHQRVHPHVRRVTMGGETADDHLLQQISKTFPNAKTTNIYASTEAGALLYSGDGQFEIPESLRGRVKIIDGQLAVHRSLLAESFCANIDEEFFLTGDFVENQSEDSQKFSIKSRDSNVINVGGYKVNCQKVESLIEQMPEVVQARVFGKSNSVTGELVCCEVFATAGSCVSVKLIRDRLGDVLNDYELPRIVNLVDLIQTTLTGKKVR